MQTVKIDKAVLKAQVVKNLEIHIKEYKESLEGFYLQRSVLIDMLGNSKHKEDLDKIITDLYDMNLDKPKSYEKDYNKVLLMIDLGSEPILSLTNSEFSQYCMDDWSWKNSFSVTNSKYK